MSDLATVSNQLAELQRSMGRVETKVDGIGALEKRVRKLENWRTYVLGAVGGIGGFIGYQIKTHT